MEKQNLTQYLFWDKSETIANEEGIVIAVRHEDSYLPLRMRFSPKVVGSAQSFDNSDDSSNVPKVGEHLVTFRGIFGIGRYRISTSRIKEINENYDLQIDEKC